VQSSLTGERETLDRLAAAGLRARVVHRERGPLGPLARRRLAALQATGRIGPDEQEEELQVIEAAPGTVRDPGPGPARITPYRDGPYLLRGDFELTDQDGRPIATNRSTVALCRCGQSQIRPFCDGSHKLVGFRCDSAAEARSEPGEPG
jgi:CDGSH-type Zn-finger protein